MTGLPRQACITGAARMDESAVFVATTGRIPEGRLPFDEICSQHQEWTVGLLQRETARDFTNRHFESVEHVKWLGIRDIDIL